VTASCLKCSMVSVKEGEAANIGLFAFCFALVCVAVSVIGAATQKEEKRAEAVNYCRIYQAVTPEELQNIYLDRSV